MGLIIGKYLSTAELMTTQIAVTLFVILLLGIYIYFYYRVKTRNVFYSKEFGISLVVLAIITAGIASAIQQSIIVSLGMVGALSIVRFRTAIKNPKLGLYRLYGNKIITGSAGGMLITPSHFDAEKVKKWSTQARENVDWYQHEELGYNYRMSNIIAGVARVQMHHLDEHISCKKAIWERYRDGLKDLPVKMNPHRYGDEPNY